MPVLTPDAECGAAKAMSLNNISFVPDQAGGSGGRSPMPVLSAAEGRGEPEGCPLGAPLFFFLAAKQQD